MNMQEFQELGESYRRDLGIDGTAGDAMDVPHPFTPHAAVECCVVCGLAKTWRKHHQAALGQVERAKEHP